VTFTVPKGWEISSVENLRGYSISSDGRTVRGTAIGSEPHEITFTKKQRGLGIPGFGVIFAIGSLLAVAFGLRRWKK